ncbi:MAG: response regulator [Elusimicrobia bacterium]|nr:response regulator [Elusimicrobiota bacterium]
MLDLNGSISKHKPLILLIEDSPKTQQVLQTKFSDLGCDVVACGNTEEAWDHLKSGRNFDVIILDFVLPGTKGPAFYEQLSIDKELSKITVVPFTSTIDKDDYLKSQDPRDWATISLSQRSMDNSTPIVSKGDSEHINQVPDDLILNVAHAIRKKNVKLPDALRSSLREILRKIDTPN